MITLLTALGRFDVRVSENGHKVPVVIMNKKEYHLGIDEFLIWSSLAWNILTLEELQLDFGKRRNEMHICSDISFQGVLNRLITRNLVVSASDYVAVDALYALTDRLYIRSVKISLLNKIKTFIHLVAVKHTPCSSAIAVFKRTLLSTEEKRVLKLCNQLIMTSAEIIKCVDIGLSHIKNESFLVDAIYNDESTTSENIHKVARFFDAKHPVLQAISNLYLKKMVVFEKDV